MGNIVNPLTGRSFNQEISHVPWEKVQSLIGLESLLKSIGLSTHCTHCTRVFGPPQDGVKMWISEDGKEVHIECNHADRVCKVNRKIQI